MAAEAAVFGELVAFAGGADPVSGPRSEDVLWYEPGTDTWTTTATRAPVYDVAATSDLLALVQVETMTGRIWLELVDPTRRTVVDDVLLDDARPQQLGVTARADGFVVAWARDERTHLAEVRRDATVRRIGSVSVDAFRPPVDVDGSLWGRPMLVIGDDLVAPSLQAVEVISLASGSHRRWDLPTDRRCAPQNTPWVTGASAFLAWGGHSCDPDDPGARADGLAIQLTRP